MPPRRQQRQQRLDPRDPVNREFTDQRGGCRQCCGSSYTRQFFFIVVPLFVLIIILAGINTESQMERRHTGRTVTVSSGNAVAMLAHQTFQRQVDAIASLTQLVKNKIWTDPYALDEFLGFAFTYQAVDPIVHRVLVSHNDQPQSWIALTDVTAQVTRSSTTDLLPFFSHFNQPTALIGEVQGQLFRGGLTQRFARKFSASRTTEYEALDPTPQTPSYAAAMAADWIDLAAGLRQSAAAGGAWGLWLSPNSSAVHQSDVHFATPSFVFFAPVERRASQPSGQVVGRVSVRPTWFRDLFQSTSAFGQFAFLVDPATWFVIMSSVGSDLQPVADVSELSPFQTELRTVNTNGGTLLIPPDGRSPYTFVASKATTRFTNLIVVTFAENNTVAMHAAGVNVVDSTLLPCLRMAEAVRNQAQSGDFVDVEDVPHLERTVGTVFESQHYGLGNLWLTSMLNTSMHRFFVGKNDDHARIETWWPPAAGRLPLRRYQLTGTGSDVGTRMLMRQQWEDVLDATSPRTDPSASLARAVTDVDGRASLPDDTIVLRGPFEETGNFCTVLPLCRTTYLTMSSCATWPHGAIGDSDKSAAYDAGLAANRSCFHLQFSPRDLVDALHGMRLDLVGMTIVAFENGAVIAAAGQSIAYGTTYNGSQRTWEVVPQWTEAGWNIMRGLQYGTEREDGGRYFVLDRVPVEVRSDAGNLVVLTVFDRAVESTTTRDVVVYAIDGVILLALFLFAAHAVHFAWHMRNVNKITEVVNAAAELQTEELPEEALRVTSWNKDVESMLISAVQLFLHMKRIRSVLPDFVLDRHTRRGEVSAADVPVPDRDDRGAGDSQASPAAAASPTTTSGVFANVQDMRLSTMNREHVVLVSVTFPSVKLLSQRGKDVFMKVDAEMTRRSGKLWITDSGLSTHYYFGGDYLSRAIEAAKAVISSAPDCVVTVCREEATFGVLSADVSRRGEDPVAQRSFTMYGPVVDYAQAMSAAVREILGAGEAITLRDAGEPLVASVGPDGRGRLCAPLIIDRATHARADPSCFDNCVVRTIGALPADVVGTDLASPDEVARSVTNVAPLAPTALKATPQADALMLREVFCPGLESKPLDEHARLLWEGVGGAVEALVTGRRDAAAELAQVAKQHFGPETNCLVGSRWDKALLAAVCRASGITA